jgi:hypothetical protein
MLVSGYCFVSRSTIRGVIMQSCKREGSSYTKIRSGLSPIIKDQLKEVTRIGSSDGDWHQSAAMRYK